MGYSSTASTIPGTGGDGDQCCIRQRVEGLGGCGGRQNFAGLCFFFASRVTQPSKPDHPSYSTKYSKLVDCDCDYDYEGIRR